MEKKSFLLLIVCVFYTLGCNQSLLGAAKLPELLEVDFGLVQAVDPIHKVQNLSIPVNAAEPDGVLVETSSLINYQNNEKIPPERITLIINRQTVPGAGSPVEVDLNTTPTNHRLDTRFDLDLRPQDHPGSYEGVILFRFWETDSQSPGGKKWFDPIEIGLQIKIEPWILLKTAAGRISLEPSMAPNTRDLENREPLLIQVASNSNWRLGVQLKPVDPLKENDHLTFSVKVKDDSPKYQGAGQAGISFGAGRKVIAAGPATVSEKTYWLEIPVEICLTDYTRFPAGCYDFKVTFVGEIN